MRTTLLAILRCPYCGSRLSVAEEFPQGKDGDELHDGVLACECSLFPVVAGIPVLLDDRYFYRMKSSQDALYDQQEGAHGQALLDMLRLEGRRETAFRRLLKADAWPTCRELIDLVIPEEVGTYLAHRFSDPTYLVNQAVWRALGSDPRPLAGRVLDLCGGAGHLARLLARLGRGGEVILADFDFRMLWLSKRIAPTGVQPLCCDANLPLPFDDGVFSGVACSDVFHYVRAKEALSREMMRVAGDGGVLALTHLHNKRYDNFNAGWPLDAPGYRRLFAAYGPRIFRESTLLDGFLSHRTVDLSGDESDDLAAEAALCLIATRLQGMLRPYEVAERQLITGPPQINPLYRLKPTGAKAVLHRQFPSGGYEEEYEACKRYLPEQVELSADTLQALKAGHWDDALRALSERYVILDLPQGY